MANFGEIFGGNGFDAKSVDPNNVLPKGDYEAVAIKDDTKETKGADGSLEKVMITMQFQVTSGQFQNRVLFERYNIVNPNAEAQRISRANMSALCRAINVMNPQNSSELLNKTMIISVGVKDDKEYGMQNKITGYKPRLSGAPSVAAPYANSVGQPGQLQTAGAPSAPWAGKQ